MEDGAEEVEVSDERHGDRAWRKVAVATVEGIGNYDHKGQWK